MRRGLRCARNRKRSEVRGQIAEVKKQGYLYNLISQLGLHDCASVCIGALAGFRERLDSGDSAGAFAHVFAHVFLHFVARARQIVRGLEVHPELRRIPEVLREE